MGRASTAVVNRASFRSTPTIPPASVSGPVLPKCRRESAGSTNAPLASVRYARRLATSAGLISTLPPRHVATCQIMRFNVQRVDRIFSPTHGQE